MRHFQNEEKVSILELDKGKFCVSVDEFLKILRQSFKLNSQMNLPRGSREPDFHAYSLTADTHQFGERSNLLAEKTIVEKDLPNIPQLPSQSLVVHSSVLVLRGIFRYGALSDDWGDIHIRNSEINIPDYIFEELLHKYLYIPEVGVRIRKLGNGSFEAIFIFHFLRRFSPKKEVELNDKETVILKTRVRNGEISLEESDVQFLRENIPQHILDRVKATFTGKPYGDFYVISDDAGKFRSVVKRGVKDITFEFFVQKKDDFLQQLNG